MPITHGTLEVASGVVRLAAGCVTLRLIKQQGMRDEQSVHAADPTPPLSYPRFRETARDREGEARPAFD